MSHYRPSYSSNTPNFHDLPPPPPPPPDMPPLPREPPPSPLDPYRNGDSWRPQPPQSDFSFRNQDAAPQYPRERQPDHYRPTRSRQYALQNGHQDRKNYNRPRGGRGQAYRPRQRVAPSDRPLLQERGSDGVQEEMLGVTDGARKFMPAEDISDSDEEEMDESDPDQGDDDIDREPPAKRRAIASVPADDAAALPKWSNPDPYTVLPPIDDAQRKRKDPVKLIRKAREQMVNKATEQSQVAANDDFISFDNEEDGPRLGQEPASDADSTRNENGMPTAPRSFSHLQNLHSQTDRHAPSTFARNTDEDMDAPPNLQRDVASNQAEIVLDLGRAHRNNIGGDDYAPDYEQPFGSRKRTYGDVIKPDPRYKKNSAANADGSLLRDWVPGPSTDPTPWLKRTGRLTANAGFQLHKEICDFYEFVKPQNHEQIVREDLLSRLQNAVRRELPDCNVHCFGSFAAGLYLPNADMDVVIVSDEFRRYGRKFVCQSRNKMFRFANFLRGSGIARADSVEVIYGAKVPLVKFVDRITAIKVDVSFENDTGIVANDTFTAWKRQYPAMPILVTVVKQFLMMRGLNEVQHGGLGGFSVTCLVTSLLQNMPRVQAGELIPEENLGEILVEFLDFYGNCLDTSRTGIMMNPPGYFDKQAFDRRSIGRGPVYQANKADRLAIMDPNVPSNDISGGSRNVMLIFDRFSVAHSEILAAMKARNRPSLLDWALGGNYDSFKWQRNHLLSLYQRDAFYHPRGLELAIHHSVFPQGPAITTPSQKTQEIIESGGNHTLIKAPITETGLGTDTTNDTNPRDTTSALSGAETPSRKKAIIKAREKQVNIARARQLQEDYPNMREVPNAITLRQRSALIKRYERKAAKAANKAAVRNLPSAAQISSQVDTQLKNPALEDAAIHETLPLAAGNEQSLAPTPAAQDSFAPLANNQSIPPKKAQAERKAERKADKSRAKTLRERYPGEKVPVSLDKAAFKILNAKLAAAAPMVEVKPAAPIKKSARLADLPPRPQPPKPAQGSAKTRQFHRRHGTSVPELPKPWTEDYVHVEGKAPGSRMAPPTYERRAEVTRNLQGVSNSDSIQID